MSKEVCKNIFQIFQQIRIAIIIIIITIIIIIVITIMIITIIINNNNSSNNDNNNYDNDNNVKSVISTIFIRCFWLDVLVQRPLFWSCPTDLIGKSYKISMSVYFSTFDFLSCVIPAATSMMLTHFLYYCVQLSLNACI